MLIKAKIAFSLLVWILFSSVLGYCTPSITNATYSGTLAVGTTITITGASFGATGPTVVIHESFENGVVGSSMTNLTAASYVGNWSTPTLTTNGPLYSNVEKFSGSQSMVTDMSLGANGGEFYNQVFLSSATQVFICTDWKLTGDWPGYGGTGANMKFNWIMNGNSTTDTDLYHGFSASGSNLPVGSVYDGNDGTFTKNFTANLSTTSSVAGSTQGWHQGCEWIDGLNQGDMRFYDLSSTGTFRIAYTTTALTTPFFFDVGNQHTFWDRIHIPGFGRVMPGTKWYHDNIYVSTGSAAAAHIWLTDQPTIFNSTKWVVLKPVSWADGTVTAMLPTSTFSSQAGYVQICDASFVCTPTGFQVTVGAAQITTPSTSIKVFSGLSLKGISYK